MPKRPPLPVDQTRCLAYPANDVLGGAPKDWCVRWRHCARHQTIARDAFDGSTHVQKRVCLGEDMAAFIQDDIQ